MIDWKTPLLLLAISPQAFASPAGNAFEIASKEQIVPAHLLYAIALAESGRTSNGQFRPWPWTLNINGTPRFFDNRQAATDALQNALDTGIKNIDIGPMQVNWGYHHQLLGNANSALDPLHNVRVGAFILAREMQAKDGFWQAVGRYHSQRPERQKIYIQQVWNHLKTAAEL